MFGRVCQCRSEITHCEELHLIAQSSMQCGVCAVWICILHHDAFRRSLQNANALVPVPLAFHINRAVQMLALKRTPIRNSFLQNLSQDPLKFFLKLNFFGLGEELKK